MQTETIGLYCAIFALFQKARRVRDGKSSETIGVRRDIDAACGCDSPQLSSMALRRVDMGRRLGLFGGGSEFQKPKG